jgi:hypothetical protein
LIDVFVIVTTTTITIIITTTITIIITTTTALKGLEQSS